MKFYKLIFLSFMTFLNVPTDRAVKPEVWKSVIKRTQEISTEKIGIPCIYGVDQIHGASYTEVLRGFEKIELEPGESATVSITIPASDLAFVGMDGKWRLEEGISL